MCVCVLWNTGDVHPEGKCSLFLVTGQLDSDGCFCCVAVCVCGPFLRTETYSVIYICSLLFRVRPLNVNQSCFLEPHNVQVTPDTPPPPVLHKRKVERVLYSLRKYGSRTVSLEETPGVQYIWNRTIPFCFVCGLAATLMRH